MSEDEQDEYSAAMKNPYRYNTYIHFSSLLLYWTRPLLLDGKP
jgi:hypothetical protein